MSKNKPKPKVPKIKVPEADLQHFLKESLTIDSYWDDLYNPPPKKKNKYLDQLNS